VRLSNGRIEKFHISKETAQFEANKLVRLHSMGLAVPKVLSAKDNIIIMEYIDAAPLPDLIDVWENKLCSSSQELAAKGVIDWLAKYYIAVDNANTGITRGDINGRNFLFDGKKVWGIDFEEQACGTIIEDIGQLLAFVLTYDPENTPLKKNLASIMANQAVKNFNFNLDDILTEQSKQIKIMENRRKLRN